jgi:outer membrane protein assembly factor BamD
MFSRPRLVAIFTPIGLLASCLLAGCGGATQKASVAKRLTYGDAAQRAYTQALEKFYDNNCFEAEPLMRNVRREYPYSRFAALADLRVADCNFKDDKFAEAIEAYNQFVRYRPSHPEVPYARFMAASANFEQIPSEWLLSPPAHERDLHYADESLRLLRRMMLDFPDDPLVERAQRLAERAVKLLAAHELYVARFYLDREYPRAAAGRLNTLLRSYPGTGFDAEALYMLGESYLLMSDRDNARRAFERLIARYPKDAHSQQARGQLSELGG